MSRSIVTSPEISYADVVTIGPYWETEEHLRPVWKLYWNRSDGAVLKHKDRAYPLKANHLFLIAPLTHYVPLCPVEVNHLYVHFHLPGELARMPQGVWPAGPSPYNWKDLARPLEKGIKTYKHQARLLALVCHGISTLSETLFDKGEASPLNEIIIWLENNIEKNCSNRRLEEISGLSQDTLNRYFLKETGMSPQVYVRRLRASRAATLLRRTTLSVDEIAERCGFCDRAHFHKVFRKTSGQTPVSFRKMHQNS